MSILVGSETLVLVQGITGNDGSFHSRRMIDYGTKVVAGVTPGKGGGEVHGVRVYDTVAGARDETGASVSIAFVPARHASSAIREAVDGGMELLIVITEGIPTLDMVREVERANARGARIVGPNCPGVISPGKSKVGIMAGDIFSTGAVGIISRSGTLTYEVAHSLTEAGIGQSTCLGIGGDPVTGSDFIDILKLFAEDDQTEAVVIIGEIGGSDEERAASFIASAFTKPVVAFVAGQTAPPGRRMGHAGAIIDGSRGTAAEKIEAFARAGVAVAKHPAEIADLVKEALL